MTWVKMNLGYAPKNEILVPFYPFAPGNFAEKRRLKLVDS